MPLFLIPILIIIGVFAISAGGDIIKNIDIPLPDFRLFSEKTTGEKAIQQPSSFTQTTFKQAPSGLSPPDASTIQEPPEAGLAPEVSSSFEKVAIASLTRSVNQEDFRITLQAKLSKEEQVTISGWTIKGSGGEYRIGKGIQLLYPNIQNFNEDIVLKPGERVLLSGAASPFGTGANFKPNICFGYLKEYYSFKLQVPSSCPDRPNVQDISFLGPYCQEFILKDISFGSCNVPDYSQNLRVASDSTCTSYIENNFNYEACFQKHAQDKDFTKNEWHVYAAKNFARELHDVIILKDKDGLLVDQYIY